MVNVTLILLITTVVFSLISLVLIIVNLLQIKKNPNYSTTSTLKAAYDICIAGIILSSIIFVLGVLALIFLFQTDFKKTNDIILCVVTNLILTAGVFIFGIILYLDNKNIYSIVFLILSLINIILLIIIFINIRKLQLYVIEQKREVEENKDEEIEALEKQVKDAEGKTVPVKEEPTITTSDFQIITTREIVPVENYNEYLPIDLSNML
jgi:hypothetical protein